MEFGYIGVHSARYSAIGRTDGNEFLLPIGPKLRRWYIDSDGLEVVGDLCYNDNLVMALERNSRFLVSTGYNSQAVVIDPKSLAKLDEVRGLGTKVRVCTVNESYYASCAEICLDGLSQTCINVWKFAADGKLGEHAKLRGSYHCPILFSNDKLLLLKIVEIVDEQKTAIAEAKVYNHKLCLFSLDSNELEKEVELSGNISEIVNYEVNEARDVVAITFLDKTTIFVDQQGQVFGTIDIVVKGTVTSATFRGDYYYFGLEPGQMVRLRPEYLRENKVSRVTVQFGQDDQFVTSMHLPDHRNIRKNSFFLLWLDEESLLLTGDEEGLYLNKLKAKRTIRMQSDISLTGCGVAVSPSGSLVGVGDFSGNANVYFFDAEELKTTLYMQANIGESVRSVCFLDDQVFLVGSIGGAVFGLGFPGFEAEPLKLFEVEGSVTCLRATSDGRALLLCTTAGYLYSYTKLEETVFELSYKHLLHPPAEASDKFGSLHLRAEVWSCQFNPLNFGLVATTSEDQTCKTWSLAANSASFSPLQEVSKHQLAATCVDWQVMKPGLGSVVACCSDDKLARAFRFSPEDQQCTLLAEVDFSFLHEFFTLTYLALEKGGSLLAIGSQIGHLFLFDLEKKELVFCEKVHLGGVEGLAIHGRTVFTCSSDNTVMISKFVGPAKTAPHSPQSTGLQMAEKL